MAGIVRLVPADFRPLLITQAIASGNAPVSSSVSGVTNTVEVAGGASTPDPGDASYYVFDVFDDDGRPLVEGDSGTVVLFIEETTPPDLSSDTYIAIALVNENTVGSATVDGVGMAIRYASANRNLRQIGIVNGTASPSDAGSNGNVRKVATTAQVIPTGSAGCQGAAFASDDSFIYTSAITTARSGPATGARWKVVVAVGRSAATAGAAEVAFKAGYRVIRHPGGYAVPG